MERMLPTNGEEEENAQERMEGIRDIVREKMPGECSEEEQEIVQAFVDVGLRSLDTQMAHHRQVKHGWMAATQSDIAWTLVNFKYYAVEDMPMTEEERRQLMARRERANKEMTRKNKRQKIATGAVKVNLIKLYSTMKRDFVTETDQVPGNVEHEKRRKHLETVKAAWGDFLEENMRKRTEQERENVAPDTERKDTSYLAGISISVIPV